MTKKFTARGMEILWPNFAGAEGQYNRAGDRNFNLLLQRDSQLEKDLKKEGWNVKYTKPRDEDDVERPFLPIAINYKSGRKPRVYLVTGYDTDRERQTLLPEEALESLDYMDILHVDVEVNPYNWSVSGNSGIKAYLEVMYVVQEESELEQAYGHVPTEGEEL